MGIQGLLPLLKECQRGAHLQEYRGQTLGIDAYVWLHRGAYSCAEEIATGQTTTKYIKYALHKIRLLQHHGVTPYVVFDGGFLPSKKGTETDRGSRRHEALAKARHCALEGKHSQAREYYVKAVDVTPQMAYQLIKALIAEGISYVVAPYEADAQLAYLERKGIIDGIITEDSDLLVFGCRKILFKLDPDGRCMEITRDRFALCREFSFSGWTDKEFRQMAILSGCDYLESIPGLGLKTAHRLMRRYKTAEKVIRFVRLEGQLKVSRDYEDDFKRAELTFLHQRVFCPEWKKVVHLEDLPESVRAKLASPQAEELRFIGPFLADEIALGIARGELCPISKAKMVDIAPDAEVLAGNYNPPRVHPKGSIKDFFKPAPAAKKEAIKSKKPDVLREISSNNLFSAKKAEAMEKPTVFTKPVKSRFFASTSRVVTQKAEMVTIDSDDEASASRLNGIPHGQSRVSQSQRSNMTAAIGCSKGKGGLTPPSFSLLAETGPDRDAMKKPSASNQDTLMGISPDSDIFAGALPRIHTGLKPNTASGISLPPMPDPAPPSVGRIEDADDVWGCHAVSSPAECENSPRPRKLRRHHSPLSPSKHEPGPTWETDEPDGGYDLLTSPVADIPAVTPSIGHADLSDTLLPLSELTDLTDYSSPVSICAQNDSHGKNRGAKRRCDDGAQTSDESFWSNEAITPDSSFQLRRSTTPTIEPSSKNGRKDTRLPRSNAVISTSRYEIASHPQVIDSSEAADFDKRVTSVVAGWRQKFAPSSLGRSSKKRTHGQTQASRSCEPKHVLSPIRYRTQESVKASEAAANRSGPSIKADLQVGKQSTSLSQSTAKVLEAFRFRPSSACPTTLSCAE